jgi:hypothetical protein
MCMTVTTSASIPNFPVITHMGIFRSPLLSQDLSKLDGALGEIRSVLSKQPDFYKDKLAKSISLVLHSFAARAMMTISNGHQAKLMITAPVAHMGGLLSEAGNIFAEKIVHATPSDADRRLTRAAKSNIGAPSIMSRPLIGPPGILSQKIGGGGNSGSLKYCLDQSPGCTSLNILYDKEEYEWTNRDCLWLFDLAFNPKHTYPPTFTNLRVLRELHQDITMVQANVVNLK